MFLQLSLAIIAFAIIFQFGGSSLIPCVVVSAIYAVAFSIFRKQPIREWSGALGAVIGWAVSLCLMIATEYFEYFSGLAIPPYFDGDGELYLLMLGPAVFFLGLFPAAALGCVIGFIAGAM